MGKFSDSPYYVLEDFLGQQVSYGTTYSSAARMVGGPRGIVAENSFGFDLYLKTELRYYRITVQNTVGSPSNDLFTLKVPTGIFKESELTISELGNYVGYELYFRKEGLFYDYVNNYVPADQVTTVDTLGELFSPNINTNKFYAYFGKLYTTNDDEIVVMYDGYKTYVNNFIPENNRNDLLTEFIKIAFDRSYAPQHNLFKNILTLSDPKEVDIDYLYYLSKYYRMTIPESLSETKKREYVAALPELLKRKGTYSSLYIIWKLITSDTINYLNVYERWHTWPLVGTPLANFNDVLYYWNPEYKKAPPVDGAGAAYYYAGQDAIYTTHVPTEASSWTVAHNLSYQYPFVQIIDSDDEMVVPYSIKYDTSNYLTVKFDNLLPANVALGRALTFVGKDEDNFYTEIVSTPSVTWSINHGLGTTNGSVDDMYKYPMTQVINTSNEMVIPGNIKFTDVDNLEITFDEPVEGRVIVGIPIDSYLHTQAVSASTWTVTHGLNTLNVMVQVMDSNDEIVGPGNIEIIDENNVTITFSTSPDIIMGTAAIFSSEGAIPYPVYEPAQSMLSPHYLTEIDLTNEPFGDTYIINQALIDELLVRWEEIRPVCKYSHYQEVIAPHSDFSGKDLQLYVNTRHSGYLYSKCCQPVAAILPDVSVYRTLVNRQTWTYVHNLDSEEAIVQCFDLDQNMIIPKRMYNWGEDITIIEWESGQAGYAYASKDIASTHFAASAIWTMTHSLGLSAHATDLLIQQTQYDDDQVFIPMTVEATDENTMTFTMGYAADRTLLTPAGYSSVTTGSFEASAGESLIEWTIFHNLETEHIQAQFYDDQMHVMYPQNVQILDKMSIKATFIEYVTPRVVIKAIGLQVLEISDRWARLSYAKIGSTGTIDWDAILKNELETPFDTIYSIEKTEGDKYYVKIIINTEEAMSIKEIGLFDTNDDIMFYSRCSEIYKPANVNLVIWYRIDKKVA